MIVIDREQMTRLEQADLDKFEERLVAHLSDYAPALARILGPTRMHDIVHRGVQKAAGHGFTNRGPIRLYLELMFSLGSDADTDPVLPWVGRILADTSVSDQMMRADYLFRAAERYFERAMGPEQQFALQAMRRLRLVELDALPAPGMEVSERAIGLLSGAYPQKAALAGRQALEHLVAEAMKAATAHQVTSDSGRLLLCAILFGFGHGALSDPIYPWIGSTLRDPQVSDPQERIRHLHRKTRTYVEAALKNLGS